MDVLVLGGTAFVGRAVSRAALARGHRVTCLARGESGVVVSGARLVRADRRDPRAYDDVVRDWDAVVEISWQPGMVRAALDALGGRAGHWTYVSSGNAYASFATPGGTETDPVREPTALEEVDRPAYGEAKVACEQASAVVGALLVARAGLIGGPEDYTGRAAAWAVRCAQRPEEALLVPEGNPMTQVVDVRDLADWLVRCAEDGVTGTYDAVGPQVPFAEHVAMSRALGGHQSEVVQVDPAWLAAQGVADFMGPESLPLWLTDPDWAGFLARTGDAARAAGLVHRAPSELVADALAWELEQGPDRERWAGLSAARERELLESWRAVRPSR